MDNVQDTAVTPQGEVQQPVEQTPAVQPAEAPVESPKPSDETNFEAIAAKKGFKSPDDLAKAYANLERQSTKVSQKAADYEKLFFSQEPKGNPVETPKAPQYQPQTEAQALDELRKFVHAEAVAPLQKEFEQKLQTELARIELNNVIKENKDFGNYVNEVKDLKGKYPSMSFTEAYTVAKALKGDLAKEAMAEGLSQGTYAARRQTQAQVIPQKPVTEDKIQPADILQGAGSRWAQANRAYADPSAKARVAAEQALLEQRFIAEGATGLETNFRPR